MKTIPKIFIADAMLLAVTVWAEGREEGVFR